MIKMLTFAARKINEQKIRINHRRERMMQKDTHVRTYSRIWSRSYTMWGRNDWFSGKLPWDGSETTGLKQPNIAINVSNPFINYQIFLHTGLLMNEVWFSLFIGLNGVKAAEVPYRRWDATPNAARGSGMGRSYPPPHPTRGSGEAS